MPFIKRIFYTGNKNDLERVVVEVLTFFFLRELFLQKVIWK
jgi:hypothetical protein